MKIKRRAGVSHILQAIESMIEFQFFATIALLLLVAFYAVVDYRAVDSGNRIYRSMGIENEDAGGFLKEMNSENEDIVAWLVLNDTEVDYPVLEGKDNNYYLSHDYEGNYLVAGSIFMDYRNDIDDDYLIIYGHHRRDGSMFGSIDKLYKNGGKITLVVGDETRTYQIFSIYETTSNDYYSITNFDNIDEAIEEFKDRSEIDFKQSDFSTKQIITLSTCTNDNKGRIVVHAYKKLT